VPSTSPIAETQCINGHPVDAGDLLCSVCGVDVGERADIPVDEAVVEPAEEATVVHGWLLGRRLQSTSERRERFVAEHESDGRRGILTLYGLGSEPDPAVYDVLRSLPRDQVAAVFETGQWQGRAFDVVEEIAGGTLADLGLLPDDAAVLEQVVDELGQALHGLREVGLRHRDLHPGAILVRSRDPLDLVITSFGSARLSDFDLDIVAPIGTTRYTAPEVIAGGVAAASDWWSLGMILLEQVTRGACFEGVNEQAFLIHVLTNGAPLPDDLPPRFSLLLRGLLARDHRERWSWTEVRRWLDGEALTAPLSSGGVVEPAQRGPSIALQGRQLTSPTAWALAAADPAAWNEARDMFMRGAVETWAAEADLAPGMLDGLRQIVRTDDLSEDLRLSLALKTLNAAMPLTHRGDIVSPGWLLDHPDEGYRLISGPAPDILARMGSEQWLTQLKSRAAAVRQRAQHLEIPLNEEDFSVHVLATSRARLAALWEARRQLLPDTDHPALLAIVERGPSSEEDLILLLSADVGEFRTVDIVVDEAAEAAARAGVERFDPEQAAIHLRSRRREIYADVERRVQGFARCGIERVDQWVDQFRLERRLRIARALVILSISAEAWHEPPKQAYRAALLDFFARRVTVSVQRGPLARMTIGKSTPRVDLIELGSERRSASSLLHDLLLRSDKMLAVDPAVFDRADGLERRTRALYSHATLYRRDTGVDGLYLGFPFLVFRDPGGARRPRIAPVMLWPARLRPEVGGRGVVSVGFDRDREEVRLNPAFDTLLGTATAGRWKDVADQLLSQSSLTVDSVLAAFGALARIEAQELSALPGKDVEVAAGDARLVCSAVLFHLAYIGQAIAEDLRHIRSLQSADTGLETALRLAAPVERQAAETIPELDRYFTAQSDPSQETAVLEARQAPGLMIEGPPGTGKSQTIVNMVADAIGRKQTLLVVCQKQAALDVVRKRLQAEHLGDRMVMIADATRDREATVRAVREQVAEVLRGPGELESWRRDRAVAATRVESLESALDRHHEALHRKDSASALSYRALIGELLALERGRPAPVDVPGLRQLLGSLNREQVEELEDACAPLSRAWLPARVEDSPLADLTPFPPDPAAASAFTSAFASLVAREVERDAVYEQAPTTLIVDDDGPYRAWLSSHASAFERLTSNERTRLSSWLPLCRDDGGARSTSLLSDLEEAESGLMAASGLLATDSTRRLLAELADRELSEWQSCAEEIARPPSFVDRISPFRWYKRRRLESFFEQNRLGDVDRDLSAFIGAVKEEIELRPWRLRLAAAMATLYPDAHVEARPRGDLLDLTRTIRAQLEAVWALVQRLQAFPQQEFAAAAIRPATSDAFSAFVTSIEHAMLRRAARARSGSALVDLQPWVASEWLAARTAAIDAGESNTASLERITAALPTLVPYQRFRARAASLGPSALAVFQELRRREMLLTTVPEDDLEGVVRRTIRREARLAWKQRLEDRDPSLLQDSDELQARVRSLAEADVKMRQANRQLLEHDIDRARLHTQRAWKEITRLRGPRALRLREFMERGADLGLMELRPVWLMNPDVASRVLPLRAGLFDTIIYDEASQMPVEYALPTLFRGKTVVVSGDEKQLPPTAFFYSRIENDEVDVFDEGSSEDSLTDEERETIAETWDRREIKDCPDLLQLSRTVLPTKTLQIHYRSVYRELVAFSNSAFYGDQLSVPVRHPDDEVRRIRPLKVVRADGVYQGQTNVKEADHVVELLGQLWTGRPGPRKSVGVVTFNRKQADVIEEKLEARAEEDPLFRQALALERERTQDGQDMSFFVKNVENVQGDERDIVIFSSTFGRNAQGTFRRTFGVLGQAGGERRLNVAITRAREEVIIVTSMPIEEISDLLSTNRHATTARDYLQAYFEYARSISDGELDSGRALLSRLVAPQRDSRVRDEEQRDGFQDSVSAFIESLGVQPIVVRDTGAFGLDFAIEDPRNGLYGLGIECDAPRHPLMTHARAREIWRPAMLRRSIPRIHRVSSHGWYHDREREARRLRDAVEQLRALTATPVSVEAQ
jgi:hypothetical protein